MSVVIRIAESDSDIIQCYPIIAELRPHVFRDDFVSTVNRLFKATGFRLAYLLDVDIKAVAGYRVGEWLYAGRYLEIDDLVTASSERSKGYGSELFRWLASEAKRNHCNQLRLVSGVQRTDAHRFYERQGMLHEAKYFSLNICGQGNEA